MPSIEELNEEIRALSVEIDFAHRYENGYDYSDEEFTSVIEKRKNLIEQRDNLFTGYCQYHEGEIRGKNGYACNECETSGFATKFDESIIPKKSFISRIKTFFGLR